jgi:hypothetical protein
VAPAGHLQAIGFIDNDKLCGMKNGFLLCGIFFTTRP